jgi:hypothetical protein
MDPIRTEHAPPNRLVRRAFGRNSNLGLNADFTVDSLCKADMHRTFLQNNRLLWALLLALGLGVGVQAQSLVNTAHVVDSAGGSSESASYSNISAIGQPFGFDENSSGSYVNQGGFLNGGSENTVIDEKLAVDWTKDFEKRIKAPIINKNGLYSTYGSHGPADELIKIDRNSGNVVWQKSFPYAEGICLGEKGIYIAYRSSLQYVSFNGIKIWDTALRTGSIPAEGSTAPPSIDDDGNIFLTSSGRFQSTYVYRLHCINGSNGKEAWSIGLDCQDKWPFGPPTIDDKGCVYIAGYKFNAYGNIVWGSYKHIRPPAIIGNLVISSEINKPIIECRNINNGELLWQFALTCAYPLF